MKKIERIFLPREGSLGFGKELENSSESFKKEFIGKEFSVENLSLQAKSKLKSFSQKHRELLHSVLVDCYQNVDSFESVQSNIEALKNDNSVTITTGHQLSLATGPLFFIYKIIHVINLCEAMNKKQEDIQYVPVFWMASEDHDFEEIQSLHLFSKNITWPSSEKGAVGRFSTQGLHEIYSEIVSFFNSEVQSEIKNLLSISSNDSYGTHFFKLVHRLFGQYGLVIIDGDNKKLKHSFIPFIKRELSEQVLENEVGRTNLKLLTWNHKPQVFVRPINLFYLVKGERIRIEKIDDKFKVNGDLLTLNELYQEVELTPENFSPNALFRTIYQEMILPNICYVGGSGELAYWTQLKSSFQIFGVDFPILQTRISAFFIKKQSIEEFELNTLFLPLQTQFDLLVKSDDKQDVVLNEIQKKWEDFESSLRSSTADFGNKAISWTEAELARMRNNISSFSSKWKKQHKEKFEGELKRLEKIHNQLYPNGIPQERFQNMLHLCPKGTWNERLSFLKNSIDPFQMDLHIFIENDETK